MKQIKIVSAYKATEELAQSELSLTGKWILYKLRKDLSSIYNFYAEESSNLFKKYKTKQEGNIIKFESVELAEEYKSKQSEIDNLEIDVNVETRECKLSDVPNITIQQMEALEGFIEFKPE